MRQEKNMLIYFSGKLVPAACVLFIMIAGVRFLGKSEYGRYNLLFNCINIAITFFIGWIQQSMLRFNSGEHKELNLQLKQFTIYSLASALLASLCIFFLDWFYFDEPLLNCFLVSVFTFCFSLFMLYLSYLQSQFRPGRYAINESSFYVITTVAIFCIIYFSFPGKMIWFYCAWLAAGISWLAVTVLRSGKVMFEALRSEFDAPFFKKTFQYGFIITSWLMISNLYNVVDRFIIRHFYDYEQVGVYSAVYDFIYRLTSFAALPVLLTLHPLIMKTWNEGRDQAALSLVRKALFLLSMLLVAELTGYLIFGDWVFNKFFHLTGDLRILAVPIIISSVLWQAALFFHKPLELQFRQKQMIIGIVISLLANVILNFTFIPRYGYQSAAYTTLASTVIYIVYVIIAARLIKKSVV